MQKILKKNNIGHMVNNWALYHKSHQIKGEKWKLKVDMQRKSRMNLITTHTHTHTRTRTHARTQTSSIHIDIFSFSNTSKLSYALLCLSFSVLCHSMSLFPSHYFSYTHLSLKSHTNKHWYRHARAYIHAHTEILSNLYL